MFLTQKLFALINTNGWAYFSEWNHTLLGLSWQTKLKSRLRTEVVVTRELHFLISSYMALPNPILLAKYLLVSVSLNSFSFFFHFIGYFIMQNRDNKNVFVLDRISFRNNKIILDKSMQRNMYTSLSGIGIINTPSFLMDFYPKYFTGSHYQ